VFALFDAIRLLSYVSLVFLALEVACVCCFASTSTSSSIRNLCDLPLASISLSTTPLLAAEQVDLPLGFWLGHTLRCTAELAFFAAFRAF